VLATLKQATRRPVSTTLLPDVHFSATGTSVPEVGLEANAVAAVGEIKPRTTWAETVAAEAIRIAPNAAT
jgi:hypothetical protein